jgi:hypothetical protein
MHAQVFARRRTRPLLPGPRIFLIVALLAACAEPVSDYRPTAATAPSTDIYLGAIQSEGGAMTVGGITNITDRDGYDNQPHFTPDGSALLYTSAHDTVQTDIYRYEVATATTRRLTLTDAASEFSATMLPGDLGFSTIHEDAQDQQLWQFDLDGTSRGGLLDDVQPVGYHAWSDANTVVMFVLGNDTTPPTLQVGTPATNETWIAAENPGRSLHRVPGSTNISFVHKVSEEEWVIQALDPQTRAITPLTATVPGREDYAWMPDGSIVMGDGSTLMRWVEGEGWETFADLSGFGVREISRIAISSDGLRIAIVGNREPAS